mgnify:CR=1 FL=1
MHHALVAPYVVRIGQTGVTGQVLDRPIGTVTAVDHHSLVYAFLVKYYGTALSEDVREPLDTVVSKDRFGLVTVEIEGETWAVVDIGMRMLQPRELATAQGFPPDYIMTGTKAEQVARIGNSAPPDVVAKIVAANVTVARRAA